MHRANQGKLAFAIIATSALQNIATTYGGMLVFGDYVYSTWNFVGINLSMVGALLYAYVTFRQRAKPSKATLTVQPKIAPPSLMGDRV